MGILRTNTLSGIGTDGPVFDGVTRLDTQGYFVPPVGGTSDRTAAGITTSQGAIRFNTDSQKLEFYAQDQWFEMVIDTPALGVGADTGAGARGIFGGGETPSTLINVIEYINISSTGNAIDFGDCDNIASAGDAKDFGDLTRTVRGAGGQVNSPVRGVLGGGAPSTQNTMDFITIPTLGDAQDFGDLSVGRDLLAGGSNASRGIYAGGRTPSNSDVIDYITIATTGNAVDFGNLLAAGYMGNGGSATSSTRMVLSGIIQSWTQWRNRYV
jgi:hypothetical protein